MQSLTSPRRLPVAGGAAYAPLGQTIPQLRETVDRAEQTARGMLEAEEALRLVRQRFDHTEDPELRESSQPRRSTTSNASYSSHASGVGTG